MEIRCLIDSRNHTGECPVWDDRAQAVWWTDIPGCSLHRYELATGAHQSFALPAACGAFALTERGDLLLALKSGLARFDPESGAVTQLKPAPFDHPDDRYNDGRCDPAGRFWVCSMRDPQDPDARAGTFFRIDPDLAVRPMIGDLVTGNGLAFSPDGRTLYMSDSNATVQKVWAWDYDATSGEIANRRVFIDFADLPGHPDGAAVDADGCYWSAANGGWRLLRFTPDGQVEREVELPVCRPTMLAFGGPDLDLIFLTSQTPQGDESWDGQPHAGGLFSVSLGIKGRPEPRFAG